MNHIFARTALFQVSIPVAFLLAFNYIRLLTKPPTTETSDDEHDSVYHHDSPCL